LGGDRETDADGHHPFGPAAEQCGADLGWTARWATGSGGFRFQLFWRPGDAYLEFSISGGDLRLREGTAASYEGPWSGGPITFSGKTIVTRPAGIKSYVTMKANLADQSVEWPPAGEDSEVMGRRAAGHVVDRRFVDGGEKIERAVVGPTGR
jgi:hypothetical protein